MTGTKDTPASLYKIRNIRPYPVKGAFSGFSYNLAKGAEETVELTLAQAAAFNASQMVQAVLIEVAPTEMPKAPPAPSSTESAPAPVKTAFLAGPLS